MKASVIISFYKKINWLKLLLAALERQTMPDFEVIVADDGSDSEVVEELRKIQNKSPLSIQHVWHPDDGFRKTTILNKAILASQSEYLIFLDGDCVPHRSFVEDHVRLQNEGYVLAGRRVNMSNQISLTLNENSIKKGILEKGFFRKLLWDSLKKKSRNAEKAIHIQNTWFNIRFGKFNKGLLGCNFSMSKKNILAVNGFDERYRHPCFGEDTELECRLKNNGIKIFSPKFCLVQYHLWHPLLSRESYPENRKLYNETLEKGYTYTPYGIVPKIPN